MPLDPNVLAMLRRLSPPGGPDVLLDVLRLFQADLPARVTALDTALEAGDIGLVERTAHAIKGSAGNIGARTLYAECKRLEDAARAGQLQQVRATTVALKHEAERVRVAIRELMA
ncbi:MAG TPA: Hpt domain-containing protein [Vicinamibacterales bacterium]|nr:Hpt domain-containing protein [Vicinamibacterales bacterium]